MAGGKNIKNAILIIKKIAGDNIKLLQEAGEGFKIIPFLGRFHDIEYPQGYTEEERRLVGIDFG